MKKSLSASLILHFIVICFAVFGIPFYHHKTNTEFAIVVDMVDISELTNLKVSKAKNKKTKQDPVKNATKSSQSSLQDSNKLSQQSKKEPLKEQVTNKDNREQKTKQDSYIKDIKKQNHSNKDDVQPKGSENDMFSQMILKGVEEPSENFVKNKKKTEPKAKDNREKPLKGETNKDFKQDLPLTLSEQDSIASQIIKRWNTTAFSGADSLGMQVTIKVKLDQEGKVLEVTAIPQNSNSPKYHAFVESAVRAVKIASPLEGLPKDKFNSWHELKLNFDSSGMVY